ncbi:lactonase family protein [Streptomyces sp. JJ36]|uniref:lactonase family protein n=1 Tax=Streptomyces sp. JJ36 TaxID=2736645 RepID=UPI001F43D017|nr:lactonase family protein [Streptomyces sp. JJ36]MCF6525974.1 lactonase family protein [Streptomyces sp. JJ36]
MTDGSGSRTSTGLRAYIGSFTSAGGRGVSTARTVRGDGALEVVHHTGVAVPDPSWLAPADGLLYTVCEREAGAAAVLSLADPDRPEPLGEPVPVGGAAPTHLALAPGLLCTANYASGSVSVLPRRADGTLGGPPEVHPHQGSGPQQDRQEGPHAHAVVPDPAGRWVLAVDLGTDTVTVYALDAAAGGLRPHREVPLRPGTGPRHLAFHPSGRQAYVVNELAPTVTVCRWDAAEGTLEPVGECAVRPGEATGPNFPSEVVVAPDGRFAWVANRGDDTVAVLALDAEGDTAELAGTVPCGGHWPRHLALHPSGQWLYAANERSGDVTWFALDAETGLPTRAGAVEAPAASCVVFA